jgi:hypothetical protein
MKALLVVLVLLVVGVTGLGFYRGWFGLESDSGGGSANVTLTVDGGKFQEDRAAATRGVQGLGHQAKEKAAGTDEVSRDGTLAQVGDGELTLTDQDGKEHRYPLAADVAVTCDRKACQAAELRPGMRIRVTTGHAAPHTATRIEAIEKDAAFEKAG